MVSRLWIDSCIHLPIGIIPLSFCNLFQLTELRMEGNSFTGCSPTCLSNIATTTGLPTICAPSLLEMSMCALAGALNPIGWECDPYGFPFVGSFCDWNGVSCSINSEPESITIAGVSGADYDFVLKGKHDLSAQAPFHRRLGGSLQLLI